MIYDGIACQEVKLDTLKQQRQARKALKHGDFSAAIATFTRIIQKNPENIDLHLQLAHCYHQAGRLNQAAEWYLKTAHLYVDLGIGVQAAALLRIYRDLRPDDLMTCRALFRRCHHQTSDAESLLEMLSDQDKIYYSMRYEEFFEALDDETFDQLLDHMQVHELQKGEVLVHKGATAESLFLIADGSLEVWNENEENNRILLGIIPTGGVCGETPLFLDTQKRIADLIAHQPCRIIEISYTVLNDIQKHNPDVTKRLDNLFQQHLLERQVSLNPFFHSLPLPLRKEAMDHTSVVRLLAGSVLFREGDRSTDVYLIRSGALAIHVSVNGKDRLFRIAKSGDVVGEIAIANNGVRTATIEVLSDVVLLCWKDKSYQHCYEKSESLQYIVAQKTADQKARRAEFIQNICTPDAKEESGKQLFFY